MATEAVSGWRRKYGHDQWPRRFAPGLFFARAFVPCGSREMQLKFPGLAESACKLFRACGHAIPAKFNRSPTDIHNEGDEEWLRFPISVHGKRHLVLATLDHGKGKLGKHVHIDVATTDFFEGDLPGKKTTWTKFKAMLDEFDGKEFLADFEGHFFIGQNELPELLSATQFEFGVEGMKLSTKSVSFAVKGSPIYSITWVKGQDDGFAVIVEGRGRITFNSEYLVKGFSLLNSTFKRVVFSEEGK